MYLNNNCFSMILDAAIVTVCSCNASREQSDLHVLQRKCWYDATSVVVVSSGNGMESVYFIGAMLEDKTQ